MNHDGTRASSNPSPDVAISGGLPRITGTEPTWAATPVDAQAFTPTIEAPPAAPAPPASTGWSPTSWRIDR